MFWWLKSLNILSQNNSNGEEMKKKTLWIQIDWKTLKTFFSFLIGTNVYKKQKYKQFRCNFEDKMDKQKGL